MAARCRGVSPRSFRARDLDGEGLAAGLVTAATAALPPPPTSDAPDPGPGPAGTRNAS